MKLLAVGDVVGTQGLEYLKRNLAAVKRKYGADITVVNGENASAIGLTPRQADDMLYCGADVVTLGNHSYSKEAIKPYLEDSARVIRPANYAPLAPGRGWTVIPSMFGDIAVINLQGRCGMDFGPDNPFYEVDRILKKLDIKLIFIDFHAEATSEKLAMAYHLEGRVSAVWGTHTHVQTNDAQVLEGGTGVICDLGMTGPKRSILGVKPEQSVAMFRGLRAGRYEVAEGPCKLEGCLFTVDEKTGRCLSAQVIRE